jgi:hypothetical protein
MTEIDGTKYDFSTAWEKLGEFQEDGKKWRQLDLLRNLAERPTNVAAYAEYENLPDYPYDSESFWRAASPTAFMNLAYQAGQGLEYSLYVNNQDPRYNTPYAEHEYRQKVQKAAVKYLKSKVQNKLIQRLAISGFIWFLFRR